MLTKAKDLTGYKLNSLDGEIGKVKEFYFDDQHWAVRYLVVDTSSWLTGRQVLISPYALAGVNKSKQSISINLTIAQIENSPSLDSDKPVSRQFEEAYYGYYGWPMYWGGPFMWGVYPMLERDSTQWVKPRGDQKVWNPNLRSTSDMSGHHIQAMDGEIGHVEDFLIDDQTWAIRYLLVDTRNWWPGKKVLVSPRWIERISWEEAKIFVNLSCLAIKQAPEYTQDSQITRLYETELHKHYKRLEYWVAELLHEGQPPEHTHLQRPDIRPDIR